MKCLALPALLLAAVPALANPTIIGVGANLSLATAGEPVSFTVRGKENEPGICAFIVNWGDGSTHGPVKVGRPNKEFPIYLKHTYAQPGTYRVSVSGKSTGKEWTTERHLACLGGASTSVKVESAADAEARAQKCPADWEISRKSADGAFACTPKKPGAAKPEKVIACPAGTSYFVNNKALGCEKSR